MSRVSVAAEADWSHCQAVCHRYINRARRAQQPRHRWCLGLKRWHRLVRAIVKTGVQSDESEGDLVDLRYLYPIFEFEPGHQLRQIIEAAQSSSVLLRALTERDHLAGIVVWHWTGVPNLGVMDDRI